MDESEAEDELAMRQGAALYSIGRALRATYDADNHDTLPRDATGLMLDLSHVPFEPQAGREAVQPEAAAPVRRGWLDRVKGILRH